jgi:LPS-assembly protein
MLIPRFMNAVCFGKFGFCAVLALALPVDAQERVETELQSSPSLQERVSAQTQLPLFLSGQHITGRPDVAAHIEGSARLVKGDMAITADRLEYTSTTDVAKAIGHVRVNKAGNVYEGPLLELRLDTFEGFFNQPSYYFPRNNSHGQAARVDFLDEQRTVIHQASFTTCQPLPVPNWMPDWILTADTISLDTGENRGLAQGALLSFKGMPLLPVPYLSFPLSDQRKSGVLPPTLGLDNVDGYAVSVPYYWNIAPNRDVTITPTVMSKRGLSLGNAFRYLESNHSGTVQLNWMPSDALRDASRWGLNTTHQAQLSNPWSDDGLDIKLKVNRVSDDNYWRDFTRVDNSLTQRLLANDATLSWTNGYFSNNVRTVKWQTLQDVSAPIVPPYNRLPQISTTYLRTNVDGFDYSLTADYTRFQSDATLTGQANGERTYGVMVLSYPMMAMAAYLKPKLQWHVTQYQFETPLVDGQRSATRVLPTLSLDSGLVFEKATAWFGRSLRQTLEPRAFYVNTPYRSQQALPNYDSGVMDFNLSTIYTENAFVGNDRISDSNMLTLGVTTRFLNPDTGAEALRLGVAQRLRFADQNVNLPGDVPVYDRISDVLLGGSLHWDSRFSMEGTVQFNPKTEQSVRSTLQGHYSPGNYRTLSAAYRFQRELSEQIDLGWQWPLNVVSPERGRWYSVGRLNYSMNESKLVDSVVGFEYDAGCWLGRVVLERLQTSTVTATQRLMFQLEFVGFSRLGVNPLKSLKDNIPGYQNLRDPPAVPSRFSNYDKSP